MKLIPRDYQTAAHDAVIKWWKHTTSPCLVEAATGSGKSIIIAMLAETLHSISKGKRVLCLAPSSELIVQNSEKYAATGNPCSVYSASIGKSLRHPVVFATEGTFKAVAKRLGHEFAGVIIDECHRITPTVKAIIDDMKEGNPNLRICGLSATPYRLGDGFVFAQMPNGKPVPESSSRDPYFTRLVYYIGAPELIDRDYLTPPVIGEINADQYDVSGLKVQKNGQYSKKSIDQAFEGWGRKTAGIVADIVEKTHDRMGVMIFAATVRHAEEIMASLPPENSRMIAGSINTNKTDRARLISDFKNRRFKFFVNVNILTTGFDAPHVDAIAILRATESVSLLQQIIGRALRKHDAKRDALILDYAGNIDKHCPDGDLFAPEIKAAYQGGEKMPIDAICEFCSAVNTFTARPNSEGMGIDKWGYFLDLTGHRVNTETDPDKPEKEMPAHFGRRCTNSVKVGHEYQRCDYYWTGKDCPACDHKNDIAARYCEICREELIDPNAKLVSDFKHQKRSPHEKQTDEVISMDVVSTLSRSGADMLRVEMQTTHRRFSLFYVINSEKDFIKRKTDAFLQVTGGGQDAPKTVTYQKNKESGFYDVYGFNRPTDEQDLQDKIGCTVDEFAERQKAII
jgi:DNA repair protein RadD